MSGLPACSSEEDAVVVLELDPGAAVLLPAWSERLDVPPLPPVEPEEQPTMISRTLQSIPNPHARNRRNSIPPVSLSLFTLDIHLF